MRLMSHHKEIAKAASKDGGRKNLNAIHIVKDGAIERLEVTDGNVAIRLSIDKGDGDSCNNEHWSASVDPKRFVDGVKDAKAGAYIEVNEMCKIEHYQTGATHTLDISDLNFPNLDNVIPPDKEDDFVVCFDPFRLANTLLALAKSIGMKPNDHAPKPSCEMRFPVDHWAPVKISLQHHNSNYPESHGVAVVMPSRGNS